MNYRTLYPGVSVGENDHGEPVLVRASAPLEDLTRLREVMARDYRRAVVLGRWRRFGDTLWEAPVVGHWTARRTT